jgi:hypothetical protein
MRAFGITAFVILTLVNIAGAALFACDKYGVQSQWHCLCN